MNVVLVVWIAVASASEARPQSLQDFSAIKTFRCDFTESEGRRTSAGGVTTPAKRETFSDLVVDNVDYRQRQARFIGNAGSETVAVIDGEMTISFLEQTMAGNVVVLSIFKRTGSLAAYKAVYSRHIALTTGDLVTSQSYGTCRGLL